MKYIRSLLLGLSYFTAIVASATNNYSVHRRYLNADRSLYFDEVVYYDGLGRPVETVQRGITPRGQSLVTYQEYDEAGRPVRTWLPVVGDGSFMGLEEVRAVTSDLYTDSHAFITTIYQNSPTEIVEGIPRPALKPSNYMKYLIKKPGKL